MQGIATADTVDDALLLARLETASRWIDDHCRRRFYVVTATRYFTPKDGYRLLVDDLLAVTSLKTDEDADRVYEKTWATTDYDLEPYNGWPKLVIATTPRGQYSFPAGGHYGFQQGIIAGRHGVAKSVEITGEWGYGNGFGATPYRASGATVTVGDATNTTVTVSDQALLAVGQLILVESERMYVTALTDGPPDTATVERGVNGSTAAAHAAAPAYIYQYPKSIRDACMIQAARLHKRKEAPFGVAGVSDMGTAVVIGKLDPDLRTHIEFYVRREAV